jgi:general secretion pathway protein L
MANALSRRLTTLREFVGSAHKILNSDLSVLIPARKTQHADGQARVVLSETDMAVFHLVRGEDTEIVRVALDEAERGESLRHRPDIARLASSETTVLLPAADILRRVVQLPIGAANNLRKILQHELDRHSPIDPSEVYFDHWVKLRDKTANRLEVELRIVKRASIDRAVALSRSLGLEPISIGVDGDIFPLNSRELPLSRAAVIRSLCRRWIVPALSVLLLVLVIGAVTAAVAREELALTMLNARVEEARAMSAVVQRLRAEISATEKRAAFLAGEKRNPMAVRILSELTRAIPDGTWITSFQLTGREVRIGGFSSSASSLIAALDQSGFFANAQFRAPLTQGPQNGGERFDLSAEVKEEGP